MPAPLPFSQKVWLSQTAVTARARSEEMKALDVALWRYENSNSDVNLRQVKTAFQAWKDKQGRGDAWRQSSRNKKGAIGELDRFLNPQFYPSDASPTSYQAGLADSRHGLLWLFANTDVHHDASTYVDVVMEGGFNLLGNIVGAPRNLPANTSLLSDAKTSIGQAVVTGASSVYDKGREIARSGTGDGYFKKFRHELEEYFRSVIDTITSTDRLKAYFTSKIPDKLETLWSLGSTVINSVATALWSNAAPFLGGAIDATNGLIKMVKAGRDRYKVWAAAKTVEYNSGHPGVIVGQIKTAMDFAIGKGLYQALRGGLTITAQAITAGAAAVVTLVASGLEFIAKVAYRIVEVWRMRNFFAHCGEKYRALGAQPASHVLFKNGVEFGDWYAKASKMMPCIPALAITSGITGDKMRWLNMYAGPSSGPTITKEGSVDYTSVISQDSFNDGVKQLELMKDWAKDYLIESRYRFYSQNGSAGMYLDYKRAGQPRALAIA